ncbi:MAG: hypothetical protein WCV91_07010 [Candidatus Margulisiibacteriota bacterium]
MVNQCGSTLFKPGAGGPHSRSLPHKPVRGKGAMLFPLAAIPGKEGAAGEVLLAHRSLVRLAPSEQVNLDISYEEGADPSISVKHDEGIELCSFIFDRINRLPYSRPRYLKEGADTRVYTLDFSRVEGESRGYNINGISFYRASNAIDGLVQVIFENGNFIGVQVALSSHFIKHMGVYSEAGEMFAVLVGKNQSAPFDLGLDGYVGPIELKVHSKKTSLYSFPPKDCNMRYGILHSDLAEFGIDPEHGVFALLRNGIPVSVFSAEAGKVHDWSHPLQYKILRDSHWRIIDAFRMKRSNLPMEGITIFEKADTYSVADSASPGGFRETCSVGGQDFCLAQWPAGKKFKPSPISMVILDGKKCLFWVRGSRFDQTSREIADLVIKIYLAGRYDRLVKRIATAAYQSHLKGYDRLCRTKLSILERIEKGATGLVPAKIEKRPAKRLVVITKPGTKKTKKAVAKVVPAKPLRSKPDVVPVPREETVDMGAVRDKFLARLGRAEFVYETLFCGAYRLDDQVKYGIQVFELLCFSSEELAEIRELNGGREKLARALEMKKSIYGVLKEEKEKVLLKSGLPPILKSALERA